MFLILEFISNKSTSLPQDPYHLSFCNFFPLLINDLKDFICPSLSMLNLNK